VEKRLSRKRTNVRSGNEVTATVHIKLCLLSVRKSEQNIMLRSDCDIDIALVLNLTTFRFFLTVMFF
jgi:hypothetical protein